MGWGGVEDEEDENEESERLHTWRCNNDGCQSNGRRNNYCAALTVKPMLGSNVPINRPDKIMVGLSI